MLQFFESKGYIEISDSENESPKKGVCQNKKPIVKNREKPLATSIFGTLTLFMKFIFQSAETPDDQDLQDIHKHLKDPEFINLIKDAHLPALRAISTLLEDLEQDEKNINDKRLSDLKFEKTLLYWDQRRCPFTAKDFRESIKKYPVSFNEWDRQIVNEYLEILEQTPDLLKRADILLKNSELLQRSI